MSWDKPSYSFGNPNAQPPTPSQTPTSADFSSPIFHTPRTNHNNFELHGGWTPKFAEEYSVFNATPGRLTTAQFPAFVETPRTSIAANATTEQLAQNIASYANHTIQTTLPLPPVDPSRRLSSSPGNPFGTDQASVETFRPQVTPNQPKGRLQAAFSGQTATPPHSVGQTRRDPETGAFMMQRDEESMNIFGTPGQQTMLDFSNMPNMFAYPMSAPATAPAFTQTKNFWDPDSSMGGMAMDLSGGDSTFFAGAQHKASDSAEWGRNNQIFQQTANIPQYSPNIPQNNNLKRPRTIAAKPTPLNNLDAASTFGFGGSLGDDPFSMATSTGAVDPGLLFTVPPDFTSLHISQAQPLGGTTTYSANLSQDQLRRSQSSRDFTTMGNRKPQSMSTPSRLRPGLQRSASESRMRRSITQKTALPPAPLQRTPKGRLSPVKQLSKPNLASIPETLPTSLSSISFTIDEFGRAHTVTKIAKDEPRTTKGGPVASDSESSYIESSSDEEPIVLPSRSSSFALPASTMPKTDHSAKKRRSNENITGRRRAGSNLTSQTSSSSSYKGGNSPNESENDTMGEDGEGGRGDAQSELRRLQHERRLSRGGAAAIARRRTSTRNAHRGNRSPSEMTDLIDMATPDTGIKSDASGDSTRCVCNQREGDSFMVQCESCEKWVHGACVKIDRYNLPKVYICAFCAQTPNMRNGRTRVLSDAAASYMDRSPLARKSFGRGSGAGAGAGGLYR